MINNFFRTGAALALVAGLAVPGMAEAAEIRLSAAYPQNSVIDFGQVLSQGGEIRITMPVPGQLAITIVQPGWQMSGSAGDVMVLDSGRMHSDLDDFGGPFGWRGISITSPSVTITTVTTLDQPDDVPDVAEDAAPEAAQ